MVRLYEGGRIPRYDLPPGSEGGEIGSEAEIDRFIEDQIVETVTHIAQDLSSRKGGFKDVPGFRLAMPRLELPVSTVVSADLEMPVSEEVERENRQDRIAKSERNSRIYGKAVVRLSAPRALHSSAETVIRRPAEYLEIIDAEGRRIKVVTTRVGGYGHLARATSHDLTAVPADFIPAFFGPSDKIPIELVVRSLAGLPI